MSLSEGDVGPLVPRLNLLKVTVTFAFAGTIGSHELIALE
jgi:hypothetical protein